MYCWTLLTRDVHATPYLLGVTDDLAKAKRLTEPHLISGDAFLCLIETVRAAFTVHGMDSCYLRPGPDWLGRVTAGSRVRWDERVGGVPHAEVRAADADGFACRLPIRGPVSAGRRPGSHDCVLP